jgi:hypothetical protein
MAIKSAAVQWRQSGDASDVESCYERMEKMDRYHGQASGIFSCDECLAGLNPSRGTELCTVVETMFSYGIIFSTLGDPVFADKVEQIAFNALPATMTADSQQLRAGTHPVPSAPAAYPLMPVPSPPLCLSVGSPVPAAVE